MDLRVPIIRRFEWPKQLPPLSSEQQAIGDDFMRHWHEVLPRSYGAIEKFNHSYPLRFLPPKENFRTLELGAGIGAHLCHEDLSIQEYHCLEIRENMACEIANRYPGVRVAIADCQTAIPYSDASFERVVVVHVLEHLPDLPRCLAEVKRVLGPGGLFSVVLPCDPGLAYEVARKISAERVFRQRYKLPYRWLARREHINSPREILSLLKQNFKEIDRAYYPLQVPIISVNLCIGITLKRETA
jgi:SAM-dependent methyltransferase